MIPDAPIQPRAGSGPPLPGEDRQRIGAGGAFLESARLFFTEPGVAFARVRESGDWASPLLGEFLCSPPTSPAWAGRGERGGP